MPRKCAICPKPVLDRRASSCSHECGYILRDRRRAGTAPAAGNEVNTAPKVVKQILTVEQEHQLRRENSRLRKELDASIEAKLKAEHFGELLNSLSDLKCSQPDWVLSHPSRKAKRATPTIFFSDPHYGETVFPEQIEYLNGYNREIGLMRTRNLFNNGATIARDYLTGLTYPGVVLAMGGDIFSGDIHEELDKTNAGPIQEEILHWLEPVSAGIRFLADEFGKVFVPCVVGNHPRGTRKPSHKMRVPNNFDWLFAKLLQRELKHDKRITFDISTSADCNFSVYSTRYRLSHGDQFRGGSGIAGLLSPLMIGDARKRKRSQATGTEYDWLLLAHWHQRSKFKRIMVNGALKGYDEYAYDSNFDFELPLQSFWLTDPVHGVTIDAPIRVLDKNEPWLQKNDLLRKLA